MTKTTIITTIALIGVAALIMFVGSRSSKVGDPWEGYEFTQYPERFVTPTPVTYPHVLTKNMDCSVWSEGITYDITNVDSELPGKILLQVKRHPDDSLTEVWSVNDDGTALTNLSYLDGLETSGIIGMDNISVSRDGNRIAFTHDGTQSRLYGSSAIRSVNTGYVEGTEIRKLRDRKVEKHVSVISPNGENLQRVLDIDKDHTPVMFTRFGTSTSYEFQENPNEVKSFQKNSIPMWHPNGQEISALLNNSLDSQTYLIETNKPSTLTPKELVPGVKVIGHGIWSADGEHLAFVGINKDSDKIYTGIKNETTGVTTIVFDGLSAKLIDWSPNGSMITVEAEEDLFVLSSDGSCHTSIGSIIRKSGNKFEPESMMELVAWSPNSERLIVGSGNYGFFVINILDKTVIEIPRTSDLILDSLSWDSENYNHNQFWNPWDKSSSKILFSRTMPGGGMAIALYGVDNNRMEIIVPPDSSSSFYYYPSWSPNREKILFVRGGQLMTVDEDGSNLNSITEELGLESIAPVWIRQNLNN